MKKSAVFRTAASAAAVEARLREILKSKKEKDVKVKDIKEQDVAVKLVP